MQIDIITLFPNMFNGPFGESIIKRAQDKKLAKINIHNLRNWAIDKRGTVDDKPYGGGVGMILRPEPIFSAINYIKSQKAKKQFKSRVILLSASGKKYNQKKALSFSQLDHLILICGHYEGIDERVTKYLADEEISIGDYVLTGGEIPVMVVVDSVIRLLPNVLTKKEATQLESFSISPPTPPQPNSQLITHSHPILESPHYTRPEVFQEHKVPQILLSGNHKKIQEWKEKEALKKTRKNRPDLQ